MQKVTPFQLRLIEELNREIKADAAIKGMTKHEWIERAIREQLQREKAV
jgi:predicted HicB family RNase H-like nuclease